MQLSAWARCRLYSWPGHAELDHSASSTRPAAFTTTDTPPALERPAEPPAQPLAQHRATHSDVPPPPTPTLQRRGFIPRTLTRQARRRTAQPHRIQPHRQLAEAIASRLKFMRDGQDISSCTRPITFNTATIASRLKILTVGGRANWVNCSPYTRFCTRSMAPNTETTNLESNSFILDFGDLGLTLHNASIYFKFTRDYILRGPRLVFLTCAGAVSTSRLRSYPCPSMPDGAKYRKYCHMNEVNLWRYARRNYSYSLEVQPPVYQKYCCMKPEFEIMPHDSFQPTALSKTSSHAPKFTEASSFINSARDDFGLSRICLSFVLTARSASKSRFCLLAGSERRVYPAVYRRRALALAPARVLLPASKSKARAMRAARWFSRERAQGDEGVGQTRGCAARTRPTRGTRRPRPRHATWRWRADCEACVQPPRVHRAGRLGLHVARSQLAHRRPSCFDSFANQLRAHEARGGHGRIVAARCALVQAARDVTRRGIPLAAHAPRPRMRGRVRMCGMRVESAAMGGRELGWAGK
ncbi:hypothetical protein DFH09DRAFT_1105663 [Mycena vulgaris]|nr:hypothetical protein DFH09DRAFT_1105663 [Mycena vulgaris]